MAGDPCQLGPVVLSKLAKQYGLEVSAMERLIHVEPYTYDVSLLEVVLDVSAVNTSSFVHSKLFVLDALAC